MVKSSTPIKRIERTARLRWVPLGKMRVSSVAQRELNQSRVDRLASNLDLEQLGFPTVSERSGHFWIIDGQHRIEALRAFGFGPEEQVQCQVYTGLTEQDEAEMFLQINDTLAVHAFDKFTKGVEAGREMECEIDRVVRANGLVVSRDNVDGAIAAVGTLRRIYQRSDSKTLARTLRITRDAYGDPGLTAPILDGIGLVCARYNGELDEAEAIRKLSAAHGGSNGLLGKAETLRRSTGNQKGHCVAAAAVDIINAGRGGKKLPNWWAAPAPQDGAA